MKLFSSFMCLLALCHPGWTGSAKMCLWEPLANQGLNPESGAEWSIRASNATDLGRCRELCCSTDGCDLALLGLPADGAPQCRLVSCPDRGCTLEPSEQFQVYRRLKVVPFSNPRPRAANTTHCQLPMKVGHCRAAFPRFYYDVTGQTCRRFTYGGCGGNKNNFASQEECEESCGGVTGPVEPEKRAEASLPSSKKVAAPSDLCSGAADPGPCRAAFPMFYYDPESSTCHSFIYGGCHGNGNRHTTMEECVSHCSDEGSFDSRGRLRNRWTAAFFLLLTLAGVCALLVAALIVITVRRRMPRHTPSLSDKEELLQDPEEPTQDSVPDPTA